MLILLGRLVGARAAHLSQRRISSKPPRGVTREHARPLHYRALEKPRGTISHRFPQRERAARVSWVPNGDLFVASRYKCMLPHLDRLKVACVCARARALSCFYQWVELPWSHLSRSYCRRENRNAPDMDKDPFQGPRLGSTGFFFRCCALISRVQRWVFYRVAPAHIGRARTVACVRRRGASSFFSLRFESDGMFCYPCSERMPSRSPGSATPSSAFAPINLDCLLMNAQTAKERPFVCAEGVHARTCARGRGAEVISRGSESASVVNPGLGHAPGFRGLLRLLIQTLISPPQTPAQSAQCRPWLVSQTDQ